MMRPNRRDTPQREPNKEKYIGPGLAIVKGRDGERESNINEKCAK
jgi:hypothetical protein